MKRGYSSDSLPILDLSRYDAGTIQKTQFLADLRGAARDVGFFYLTGHGISAELLLQVQHLSHRFFALPEQEKLAVAMVNSPHFRGYNRAGAELTGGAPDWREQFDIGAEREALPAAPDTPLWTRLQGPNQWPRSLPELRPTLLRWQAEMTLMARRLARAFSEALGLPESAFDSLYEDKPNQHIKLCRYPGQAGQAQGVGAHKDAGFLTFLLQDRQRGLQVEVEPGRWIDAVPLEGTLVVNIGELLELATDGYLRATTHRVLAPPSGEDRLSVAFFLGARLDAVVPRYALPAPLAAQARGVATDPANPLFREVGFNYLKGRLRSHPDVALRHYPELEHHL